MSPRRTPRAIRFACLAALTLSGALAGGCASRQQTFATPEDAVWRLISTAKEGNKSDIEKVLGPKSSEVLSTGDPVQDRNQRQVFVAAADEQWHLQDLPDGEKELVIGYEEWPFPIPLVESDGAWRFDTDAGIEEILARRIGRNELAAIDICRTYFILQNEYAETGHDGNPPGAFAQRFWSTPGKHDGLYWKSTSDADQSPAGELVAVAADEGYTRSKRGFPRPFHGYYFRILDAQTGASPDGARSYVVNGAMTGGFALVAYPASYGQSGVMSFIINQDGVVLQSDLGEDTAEIASAMTSFDPTDQWKIVE